jgi:hypothetical protein
VYSSVKLSGDLPRLRLAPSALAKYKLALDRIAHATLFWSWDHLLNLFRPRRYLDHIH